MRCFVTVASVSCDHAIVWRTSPLRQKIPIPYCSSWWLSRTNTRIHAILITWTTCDNRCAVARIAPDWRGDGRSRGKRDIERRSSGNSSAAVCCFLLPSSIWYRGCCTCFWSWTRWRAGWECSASSASISWYLPYTVRSYYVRIVSGSARDTRRRTGETFRTWTIAGSCWTTRGSSRFIFIHSTLFLLVNSFIYRVQPIIRGKIVENFMAKLLLGSLLHLLRSRAESCLRDRVVNIFINRHFILYTILASVCCIAAPFTMYACGQLEILTMWSNNLSSKDNNDRRIAWRPKSWRRSSREDT